MCDMGWPKRKTGMWIKVNRLATGKVSAEKQTKVRKRKGKTAEWMSPIRDGGQQMRKHRRPQARVVVAWSPAKEFVESVNKTATRTARVKMPDHRGIVELTALRNQ